MRVLSLSEASIQPRTRLKVRWRGVSNPRSWVNRRNKHRSGDLTGAARRQTAKELRPRSDARCPAACPLPLLQGTPHFGENFRGLVLGCMGTYDSESRRIFSDFSRSTRFSFLCTAPHSNICQFFVFIFAIFSTKFHHFLRILNQFHVFSSRF